MSSWIRGRTLWKGYESKSTLEMTYMRDFFWFSMLVWKLFFSWWKWREFISLHKVLNLSKRKFLTRVYWAYVLFSSLTRFYILVFFYFGLPACLLYFFVFVLFFCLPWTFDAFWWQNRGSSYVCRMLNIVTVGELRNNSLIERSHQRTTQSRKLRINWGFCVLLTSYGSDRNQTLMSLVDILFMYFFLCFFLILR